MKYSCFLAWFSMLGFASLHAAAVVPVVLQRVRHVHDEEELSVSLKTKEKFLAVIEAIKTSRTDKVTELLNDCPFDVFDYYQLIFSENNMTIQQNKNARRYAHIVSLVHAVVESKNKALLFFFAQKQIPVYVQGNERISIPDVLKIAILNNDSYALDRLHAMGYPLCDDTLCAWKSRVPFRFALAHSEVSVQTCKTILKCMCMDERKQDVTISCDTSLILSLNKMFRKKIASSFPSLLEQAIGCLRAEAIASGDMRKVEYVLMELAKVANLRLDKNFIYFSIKDCITCANKDMFVYFIQFIPDFRDIGNALLVYGLRNKEFLESSKFSSILDLVHKSHDLDYILSYLIKCGYSDPQCLSIQDRLMCQRIWDRTFSKRITETDFTEVTHTDKKLRK